jgi:hypothetical protein
MASARPPGTGWAWRSHFWVCLSLHSNQSRSRPVAAFGYGPNGVDRYPLFVNEGAQKMTLRVPHEVAASR